MIPSDTNCSTYHHTEMSAEDTLDTATDLTDHTHDTNDAHPTNE